MTVRSFAVALLSLAACLAQDDTGQVAETIVTTTDPGPPKTPTPSSYVTGQFQQTIAGGVVTTASIIGVGDASPWIVGTDTNVYHYNNDCSAPRTWDPDTTTTATQSLAVSPEGTPWRVDTTGRVWKRNAPAGAACPMSTAPGWASGTALAAQAVYEIGVGRVSGTDNTVWAIGQDPVNCPTSASNNNCNVYLWNGTSRALKASNKARHVAVAPNGTTYITDATGNAFKWNGTSFQSWPGIPHCVQNPSNVNKDTLGFPVIGAAPNDAVWIIGCDDAGGGNNDIFAYTPMNSFSPWTQTTGGAKSISVSADGTPWVTNAGTVIYEYISTWQPVGPFGFTATYQDGPQTSSGVIHDVDPSTSTVVAAVESGGVWVMPQGFPWAPISDPGAGVGPGVSPMQPLPSVSTVAVRPGSPNTIIFGTGMSAQINWPNNGNNKIGNGIFFSQEANLRPVQWQQANCVGNPSGTCPSQIVKIRWGGSGTVYALANQQLLVNTGFPSPTFAPAALSGCTGAPTCLPTWSSTLLRRARFTLA
jgi:hypothetical protein